MNRTISGMMLVLALVVLVLSKTEITIGDLAARYLTEKATGNVNTARARSNSLKLFIHFTDRQGVYDPKAVTPALISDFVADLSRKYEPSTVKLHYDHVRSVFEFAKTRGLVSNNPVAEVKPPALAPNYPKWLKPEEILKSDVRIKQAGNSLNYPLVRAAVVCELMLKAGMRCDEVRQLNRSHLDTESWHVNNFVRKGGKYSTKKIAASSRGIISHYLRLRERELYRLGLPETMNLPFILSTTNNTVNPDHHRVSLKTIYSMVTELLGKDIHPHRLRHTFVRRVLDNTNDLLKTAQAADHSNVRLTMRYAMRSQEELDQTLEEL